jgi:hypothetical protein
MIPKEKAQGLVNKYKPIVTLKMGFEAAYILKKAKEAALIAVDEILGFLSYQSHIKYWQEVKQEIEKL